MKIWIKPIRGRTDGTVCTNHGVRYSAVCADHCISADEHVLLHLAAVTQTDPRLSVHVMSGVSTAPAFVVGEVGLGCDGIDPASDHVGGHGVVHKEIRHPSPISIFSDVHVNLVPQDLKEKNAFLRWACIQ